MSFDNEQDPGDENRGPSRGPSHLVVAAIFSAAILVLIILLYFAY